MRSNGEKFWEEGTRKSTSTKDEWVELLLLFEHTNGRLHLLPPSLQPLVSLFFSHPLSPALAPSASPSCLSLPRLPFSSHASSLSLSRCNRWACPSLWKRNKRTFGRGSDGGCLGELEISSGREPFYRDGEREQNRKKETTSYLHQGTEIRPKRKHSQQKNGRQAREVFF